MIDSVKEDIKRLHDKVGISLHLFIRFICSLNVFFSLFPVNPSLACTLALPHRLARSHLAQFKTQYRHSEAYHMSQMRDLPPIAGAIIWARQIERQLLTYMKRVEDVLGKGWELYAEGQKLQSESSAFRRKLDTRPVYEAWLHDINRRDMGVNGRLFEIVRLRSTGTIGGVGGGGGREVQYQLAVNFDPQIITLFKEVRNLLWLNFQVPHAIANMAKDAKRVYPHAVSLMETVRTYGQTLDLVERNRGIEWLVAEYRNEAQRMVAKGMSPLLPPPTDDD